MDPKTIESGFLSIGKSDLVKSLGPALLGIVLTVLFPIATPILAALKAGVIPVLPASAAIQELALKALGTGLESAGVYLVHKFISTSDGSPLGGVLDKYFSGGLTEKQKAQAADLAG